MPANFDKVAPFYDMLARLVFGDTMRTSQACFLKNVPLGSRILILGGGTGHILNDLDRLGIEMDVVYIECSREMLRQSREKRPFKTISVSFVQGTEANIPGGVFDVVITAFFLDVFDEKELPSVMQAIHVHLSPGGIWLQTDFVNTKLWWQRGLVKVMYVFFRLFANLPGSKLVDFSPLFAQLGLKNKGECHFFKKMIVSTVYEKT